MRAGSIAAGCLVLGAECWVLVSGVGCRVRRAGCRVQGAECGVQGAECRVRSAVCNVPRAGTSVADHVRMAARRFEELDAWKLADELKKKVYALLDRTNARNDRRFCDQLTAAAASAPANLAEGFGYYRHPEFAKHTRIAKSSLMET